MKYDFLEDNLLIICPNDYKMAILEYLTKERKVINIKFMTINEYVKKVKFDYDENSIHYLIKKGMKPDNAISFLDNLLYVEDKEYHNEKLDYLVNLKKELDDNNLLIYDNFFKKMLANKKIVIYGYGKLDKWKLSLFNNPTIINYFKVNTKYQVYNTSKIDDEVEMVFQKISDLLKQGIDINKISIMNIDSEYIPIIKKYSMFYQIPVVIPSNDTLMGTMIGKEFYDLVLSNTEKEEIFAKMCKYENNKNFKTIINILNKYANFSINEIHEEIKYDLLNTKVQDDLYENVVKIKNVFDYVFDDEYVFLVNFNNPSIPNLYLDIDYITDNIKDLVGLPSTLELNTLSKENTLNYLSSIQNLTISYKNKTSFNTYYPSILLDMMDYEQKEYERSFNYSHEANKSLYTMYLDDYVKYGIKNSNIDMLYQTYGENNYLAYHNEFSGIDNNLLLDFLKNSLVVSYSSINNYYECAFKYYLANILKVNPFLETFFTILGSLCHEVLSHINDDNFDLDRIYDNYLQEKELTNKERFFFDKIKNDLKVVVEVIKKHQFITGFNEMLYEQEINIEVKKSPYVRFNGYVDKIMYKEKNNEILVSIIDYKTGNIDINIKNLVFGLSMQLPIYLYLVKNSGLFKNIKFTGFYLQHLLDNRVKKGKKTASEQIMDNLKLMGYTTNDLDRLAIFDSTYENSEMISGVKLNKDGTLPKKGKFVSDEEIEKIVKLTEEKIMEATDEILKGEFTINPKMLDGKNVSCELCPFSDICYHSEKDNVYLVREEGEIDESNTGTEISD